MGKVAVKVIIYTKPGCSYCIKAKQLLHSKNIEYEEVDIIKNPELFIIIKSEYDVKTVPQIFIVYEDESKIHINGYDELNRIDCIGKLDSMLHLTSSRDDGIGHDSSDHSSTNEPDNDSYHSSNFDSTEHNMQDPGIEIM
ncbi:hypothetical protein BIY23_01315 [Wolbachia pipientis]|uniref:Glutaredoxin domain-containing protein n=1 Tax=Wolbachia pipientis TaxID=955 RepID=A0A1E7QL19_WOLPI|nr:glutaredoxin domain-containing protein [Wolbachia pipientis]OEY87107.1 hypothetical protein BIY23_01315 [Wolbachia pipientis]